MAISFGGLSTGLDTNSIIDQLMNVERLPVVRYENDKTWLTNKLTAFTELDGLLKTFQNSMATLKDPESLLQRSVSVGDDSYFSATVTSDSTPGANYNVEVVSLAEVQKSISETNFSSKSGKSFGTGDITLTVDGTEHIVSIDSENNSLEGIMEAINDADIGVNASIINDGTESTPYRLVFTGQDVATEFSFVSALSGGSETIGDFMITQPSSRAHIIVDNVDIYADSNILDEAISGVTLNLLQAQPTSGETTSLNVSLDSDLIQSTIKSFVTGYNGVVGFISSQSSIGDTEGGLLSGDSGINSIKRHLQNMLTTPFANSGVFTSLSELGFETQKDGTLQVDDSTLSAAVNNNIDSVVTLLTGEDDQDGLATQFNDYLFGMTSSTTGMLKGRKDSITTNIARIDTRIEMMESRLEKRETTLRSQFAAMEILVGQLNATSDYLTQQMESIANLGK